MTFPSNRDQASLTAYIRALSLTQPSCDRTPAKRVCEVWSVERGCCRCWCCARGVVLAALSAQPQSHGRIFPGPARFRQPGHPGDSSQQQSTTAAAAAPVRGGSSTSPAPPSPPQQVDSMATEQHDRCPICLDSWEEASYVMPCLHQFCYTCILRWAQSKPECPLCKRRIHSIIHSVQGDDDFQELVIPPPAAPSVVTHLTGAPGHRDAHNLHGPAASQPSAVRPVPRAPVGGLHPHVWALLFRQHPVLLRHLVLWLRHQLRLIFEGARQEAAEEREGSPEAAPGPAASQRSSPAPSPAPSSSTDRSEAEELPSTSSAALRGGPTSTRSVPVPTHGEPQEPREDPEELQEDAEEAGPMASTPIRGSPCSPGRARRAPKRRAGSPEATSPPNKRPPHRQL
nr:uncharacterized protein LOC110364151 [Columba livia]